LAPAVGFAPGSFVLFAVVVGFDAEDAVGLTAVGFFAATGPFVVPLTLSAGFLLIAPGLDVVVFAAVCTGFNGAEAAFLTGAAVEAAFFATPAGFAPAGAGRAFLGVPASIFFWGAAVLLVVVKVLDAADVDAVGGAR